MKILLNATLLMNSISKDIYSERWLALELMDSTLFDLRKE